MSLRQYLEAMRDMEKERLRSLKASNEVLLKEISEQTNTIDSLMRRKLQLRTETGKFTQSFSKVKDLNADLDKCLSSIVSTHKAPFEQFQKDEELLSQCFQMEPSDTQEDPACLDLDCDTMRNAIRDYDEKITALDTEIKKTKHENEQRLKDKEKVKQEMKEKCTFLEKCKREQDNQNKVLGKIVEDKKRELEIKGSYLEIQDEKLNTLQKKLNNLKK